MKKVLLFLSLSIWGLCFELNLAPKVLNSLIEKKFVVCIPSYNNEDYFERNLDSIRTQHYNNFRVIYTDDASTDSTHERVLNYLERYPEFAKKVEFIHNPKNQGAMCNLYHMIHSSDDEAIIITLDGDDWLANKYVLRRINQAYLDPAVWVTYGTFKTCPGEIIGPHKAVDFSVLKNSEHREIPFMWSHLRTFYAKLFKKIPSHLLQEDNGQFFSMGWDVAIMFNLIDMATEHVFYVPEVMYIYNMETPLNDFKINEPNQLRIDAFIRTRAPLKALENWDD